MQPNQVYLRTMPIVAMVALLVGCASSRDFSALPTARSLGASYSTTDAMATSASNAPVPEIIQLSDALTLALRDNPELAMFSQALRMADAQMLQAAVRPNPELALELGEYDRNGSGFDSSETAVTLGQVFELGGKRRWRRRIAEAESELAGWDYESKRLDVFSETARFFSAVLIAEERLALMRGGVELATQVHRAVSQRVSAGKETPLQSSKSDASLVMAQLDAQQAESSLAVARRQLAAMWGATQVGFDDIEGDLRQTMMTIPSLDIFSLQLTNNPALARWDAQLKLDQAMLSSERATRVPDIEGSITYLQFEEDGTDALAFGVSLPLPVFDRNQGAIAFARHNRIKTLAAVRATEIALETELAEVHAILMLSNHTVMTLREDVVPAMETVFQAECDRYEQGKSGLLEMLDAQRELFEAKVDLLDAQERYQDALIDIQRLTVTDIETLMNKEEE